MGRKIKFGIEVVELSIALRKKGHTYPEIRDIIKQRRGDTPSIMWISTTTRGIDVAPAAQVADVLAEAAEQEAEGLGNTPIERLKAQADQIEKLRSTEESAASVASLSRVYLATQAEILKREPPEPVVQSDPPDWAAAAQRGREKMHEMLAKILAEPK